MQAHAPLLAAACLHASTQIHTLFNEMPIQSFETVSILRPGRFTRQIHGHRSNLNQIPLCLSQNTYETATKLVEQIATSYKNMTPQIDKHR